MPIRRGMELFVKMLVGNILGALCRPIGRTALSSFLYDSREKHPAGVSIPTHQQTLVVGLAEAHRRTRTCSGIGSKSRRMKDSERSLRVLDLTLLDQLKRARQLHGLRCHELVRLMR